MTIHLFGNRVSGTERAFLARQLATMLTSGLAIDRGVAVLANQTGNAYLQGILKQIETDLEAGLAFSTAIAKHPRVFNRVFVNVVVAGEAVGKVAEVLQEMATRLEQENDFVSKVRGALYYPLFVVFAMIIIGALLIVNVIPRLKGIFVEAGVQLPTTTRLLIAMSDFLASSWWLALIGLAAVVVGLRFFLVTARGKIVIDFLALRMPGGLFRDYYMTRFTRTLALLVQSGTPIIEALAIVAEVVNNQFYEQLIQETKDEVARGIPMSAPLAKSSLFPLIVPQMIMVGEQTGRLDQVLQTLADYYQEETNTKLKALSSLFEPVMIVIVGLGVGFLVLSIFRPIYEIAQLQ